MCECTHKAIIVSTTPTCTCMAKRNTNQQQCKHNKAPTMSSWIIRKKMYMLNLRIPLWCLYWEDGCTGAFRLFHLVLSWSSCLNSPTEFFGRLLRSSTSPSGWSPGSRSTSQIARKQVKCKKPDVFFTWRQATKPTTQTTPKGRRRPVNYDTVRFCK